LLYYYRDQIKGFSGQFRKEIAERRDTLTQPVHPETRQRNLIQYIPNEEPVPTAIPPSPTPLPAPTSMPNAQTPTATSPHVPSRLSAEEIYQKIATLMKSKQGSALQAEALWLQLRDNYPDDNRVGCGALYLARMYHRSGQNSKAADMYRITIRSYYDHRYGDGTQVGPYAKYQYSLLLESWGRKSEARALLQSIVRDDADALNHAGQRLGPIASLRLRDLR